MGQPRFFDLQQRYKGLDAKSDPLAAILAAVPFELFRGKVKMALVKGGLRKAADDRKSAAGRKLGDEVLIFKALVLQALYNLSDDQMEYQLRDGLSFMRFVGLGLEDAGPDAKTLWLYREALGKAGAVVRGAPCHPQTHGKIERWHQTLKNRILLENYFLPCDLEIQIEAFVEHYNHRRYHQSLKNVTPADAYFGRAEAIIKRRERIKRKTIEHRRLQHRKLAA